MTSTMQNTINVIDELDLEIKSTTNSSRVIEICEAKSQALGLLRTLNKIQTKDALDIVKRLG